MSTTLSIRLLSETWGTGTDSAAVAEVVRRPGATRRGSIPKITVPIGVNSPPQPVHVEPGEYTVRLYLPTGDIMAESVVVAPEVQKEVRFELQRSPHEWLGSESAFGAVQRLPEVARARALEAFRSDPDQKWDEKLFHTSGAPDYRRRNARARVTQAIVDLDGGYASMERISGSARVPGIVGWRRVTKIDIARPLPERRLSTGDLVRWWTGVAEPGGIPLQITHHDERNAKLVPPPVAGSHGLLSGERRVFATVKDPMESWHYAVLPEGWVRTSRSSAGSTADANVLMTVVIDSVMRSSDDSGEAARWRCAPSVSDVETMTYLGFLHSGQSTAAEVFVHQARDFLFEKTMNPVAAAAGAFGLLTFSLESNSRNRPQWRRWIQNLYTWFPQLPDGAIAMAQMYLRYGESDGTSEEDIDVEKLRQYALDAVRRGLPYLSFGISPLSEILLLLVRDDEEHKRAGVLVEDTRLAHRAVQQLGRIVAPGEFFTVLKLGETAA